MGAVWSQISNGISPPSHWGNIPEIYKDDPGYLHLIETTKLKGLTNKHRDLLQSDGQRTNYQIGVILVSDVIPDLFLIINKKKGVPLLPHVENEKLIFIGNEKTDQYKLRFEKLEDEALQVEFQLNGTEINKYLLQKN